MWVGRATVFLVGLSVILAMVVGLASSALAANGQNFIIGNGLSDTVKNIATLPTKLTMQGTATGSALQVTQQSTNSGASGVGVTVPSGKAPIKVNSAAGKATNLNADKLDGLDSTRLVEARGDINGNSANFSGILEHSEGASFLNTGFHTVVAHAPNGPPVDVLLSCPSQTGSGTLRIVNNTAEFGDSQRVWVDDGSANPSFNTLGQNQSVEKSVSPSGDHLTIQVSSVFNANRMATIELFTEQFGPSVCVAKAHVIYTFGS
jgi:hypothetical protein